jgi:hypothetical protein
LKQHIYLIILFLFAGLSVKAQQDSIIMNSDTVSALIGPVQPLFFPEPPEKIVFPVDTQAVLDRLNFKTINYDSLFSLGNESGVILQPSSVHVNVRDFILPIFLLVMLAYVTWLRYVFAKELGENITVLLNSNLGQQIYRDREFSANIFKLLTFVNFAFSAGIFVFLVARFYQVSMPFNYSAFNIAAAVSGIVVLYLLRGLIYRLVGSSFKLTNALQFYRFNSLVIYHLLGIGMLPLVILGAFADPPVNEWALKATFVLLAFAMLVRLVKGFAALRLVGRFHLLYFLMYICALEIAPVLIAIKVFSNWVEA